MDFELSTFIDIHSAYIDSNFKFLRNNYEIVYNNIITLQYKKGKKSIEIIAKDLISSHALRQIKTRNYACIKLKNNSSNNFKIKVNVL